MTNRFLVVLNELTDYISELRGIGHREMSHSAPLYSLPCENLFFDFILLNIKNQHQNHRILTKKSSLTDPGKIKRS